MMIHPFPASKQSIWKYPNFFFQYADSVKGSMVHLENPEWQTRWYFKYFLGKCKYISYTYQNFTNL